jgi:hypothetical protein
MSLSINSVMQFLPVYLYQNNVSVILDLDPTVRGVNQVMYQRDLKIQKGIKNEVRIQFKNSDQKRVPVSNTQTFVFSMFDTTNQRLLIQKTLDVLDDGTTSTRGMALLTLDESDTLDLMKSSYTYSVKYASPAGGYLPAYANSYYGMNGTLYVSADIYPNLQPSTEVVDFQKSFNAATQLYEHKSGNLYASPEFNGNSALHTVAYYMTNFKGTIKLQGTLYNDPSSFDKYFTISSQHYNGFTGIDYTNFNGVFSYIRVMYIPDTAPIDTDNDNPTFYGSFDKLLYRC